MGILPVLGGIQGSRPALGGEATQPYQKNPQMSAGRDKIIDSKPSSSGSMLILSGVYNSANITFISHCTPPVVDPPSIPTSTVPVTIEVLTSAPSAPRHGEVLRRYTGAGENPCGFRKRGWGQTKQRFLAPKSEKTMENCGYFWLF